MRIKRSNGQTTTVSGSPWWSVHTHSRYSYNDAMPTPTEIVNMAADMGQKAVGLTDHGNMAGSVELYQACAKRGLKAFPGSELYFVPDIAQHKADYANKSIKASRYHLGVVAYTTEGYENLVNLSTISHQQHFHKPLVDFTTFAQLAEDGRTAGLAITTGCYFGYTTQQLITKGEEAAKQFLYTLESWFPKSVYVEMQNHCIDHGDGWNDESVSETLRGLANAMGLPCVITQDSHYLKEEDKEDHESLKRLVAFGPEADDAVFPGDGFHLASDDWIGSHHSGARLADGLAGLQDLLSRHRLEIPVLDRYSYAVPHVVSDPQTAMETRCFTELQGLMAADPKIGDKHLAQLQEEFDVIKASDMAGYMMLVAMVTDYMRENHIVFQTRGSAAGSLVCWLLGISSLDPIKWNLRFERFLSRDRTKPPDIDLDIAHDRREEVLAWLDTKFAAHQIGSWGLYGLTAEEGGDKGSLLVRYFSRNKHREGETATKWEEIPEHDKRMLWRLNDRKLYKGMGTNAAGVVITSTKAEFDKLVPLAYMSRGGFVTQYSKDDIESLGLVKLDVLGSKTLTVLQKTMENMGKTVDALEEIPLRDRPTYRMMHTGNTAGIFQLEGKSTAWGLRKLKPSTIHDVIAAMALFRPAIMSSGGTDAFIRRKHNEEPVPKRHDLIMKVSRDTYGVMLYQEQVIDLLRGLGMEAEDLTKFLKAVKASNKDIGSAGQVIKSYQEWIQRRCDEIGMDDEDREFLDEAIAGFAEYGFNRAHASVYGITAYRCAYLAMHHGLEFHAGLLAVAAGDDKEPGYLRATRQRGIRISAPRLNVSGSSYSVDRRTGAIRKGLMSIKGIGVKSAEVLAANGPYKNIEDLLEKTPAKPITGRKTYDGDPKDFTGVLGALYEAGALEGLIA